MCILPNYGEILRIQSKYGKTHTKKNSVFGHFSHSVLEINCEDGKKGFKTNDCLFSKFSGDVQEKNGKLETICYYILWHR